MSFLDSKSFTFNGVNSDTFKIIKCWIDESPDITTNGLKRTVNKGELKQKMKTNTYGVSHDDNISFSFSIMKKNHMPFKKQESLDINKWLMNVSTPKLLTFNDRQDKLPIHYYAICTSIDDIYSNDGIIMKTISFETNSPFGYMDIKHETYIIAETESFFIENLADTVDDTGYYYPTIKINYSTDIKFTNVSENKSLNIVFQDTFENGITIDGNNMRIIDNKTNKPIPLYKLGLTNENLYWFKLIKGTNEIKIESTENVVVFTYEFPRKVGLS